MSPNSSIVAPEALIESRTATGWAEGMASGGGRGVTAVALRLTDNGAKRLKIPLRVIPWFSVCSVLNAPC